MLFLGISNMCRLSPVVGSLLLVALLWTLPCGSLTYYIFCRNITWLQCIVPRKSKGKTTSHKKSKYTWLTTRPTIHEQLPVRHKTCLNWFFISFYPATCRHRLFTFQWFRNIPVGPSLMFFLSLSLAYCYAVYRDPDQAWNTSLSSNGLLPVT
jgi:hypothetical protein